jgi:hypothetical protein
MQDIITIVIPWFGPDTAGGAETQARQLAAAIRDQGAPIEVWTTVGRDSFAPATQAHYALGHDSFDGIPVRRFAIRAPQTEPYIPPAVAKRGLQAQLPNFPDHELRLLASLVSSDDLLEAVASEGEGRRFVFMPYPFPTSFWGTLLAGDRAYLLPCLHDEPYAYYSTYRWMFRAAQCALANSPAERSLALRLFDLPADRVVVAGEGIDLTPVGDGARFRAKHGLHGPLLMAYLREYWARRGTPIKLLLMGRDPFELPPAMREIVLDLGYVSVQEKHDAYAAADVYVHPSLIESFSIVLMEAWLQGTPALVHADCAVTREAAETSGGGLSFGTFGEFAAALDLLLANADLRKRMGELGRKFVLDTCRWEDVAAKTISAVLGAVPA